MPAPTVVAVASGTGATSATVNRPADAVAGDLLIAVVVTHGVAKLVQPAGWQVAQEAFTAGSEPVLPGYGCMAWRRVGESDPASWTWAGGTSSTTCAVVAVRGGRETGDPFDSSSAQANPTAPTPGSVCPAIVTSAEDTLVVAGVACMDNRGLSGWAVTDPGALTEAIEVLNITGLDSGAGIATGSKADPGSTGNLGVSLVFSSYVAFLGAVLPSGVTSSLVTRSADLTWAVDTADTTDVTSSTVLTWAVQADTGPAPGSASVVRVRHGGQWRTLTGGIPTILPPTPPRDLAVAAQSGQLGVTWRPPYDPGGLPVVGYRLVVSPPDAAPVDLGPLVRAHTVNGLTNGTAYRVTLTASTATATSPAAEVIATPSGAWVLGSVGPIVGPPEGWGGNGGVDNGRGYYAATEPPPGVWNGFQMGPEYCGVRPVLAARGMSYADLVEPPLGTFYDARGEAAGVVTLDPDNGSKGLTVTKPGALLEYVDLVGQINVNAPNVTIRYSRFDHRPITGIGKYLVRTNDAWPGLNISYCELICGLATSAAIPPYGSYTARYCEVWHVSNDAFKVGTDTLVEFNWVHTLNKAPGAHADATQWTAGDNIAIRFNNFDLYKGAENAPSPELQDMANGAVQVGHMTGDGSWFEFSDNYADGSNLIYRPGVESPQHTYRGTFYTTNAFWYRNRAGLRFIGGPVRDACVVEANQIFDETNVWHVSGQTYHRQGVNPGRWFYSHVVTEGQPLLSWTAAHFGTYP